MRSMVSVFVCCGFLAIAHADPVKIDPQKQAEADRLFTEGRELLNRKMPAEACVKFEQAIKDDPRAAGTMLNLGLCYEELEKYHTALSWYRKAQARASESGLPDHESAAKEHASKLASLVPAVSLDFKPPIASARVRIDGEKIEDKDFAHVELDPGHHQLEVRAQGKKTAQIGFEVEARGGEKSIAIELVDGEDVIADPGKGRRHLALGLGAGGAALLGFTLTYAIIERVAYDNDKANPAAANHDAHELRVVGTTTFFVGAALVGAAAYLFFTAPEKRGPDQVVWAPLVGPDQLGFAVSGGF